MYPSLRHWLHRRQRPERYAHLEALLSNQALSREALLHRQRQAFDEIVAHAVAKVPYYARRIGPLASRTPDDLPILTKEDVRAHLDDLLARDADRRRVKLGHTGGSTGTPLAFWYDEAKHELMRAGMMRGFMMSGWRPGQKVLCFWGARQDTVLGGLFGPTFADFLSAERTVAACEFSEARLHEWAGLVQTWRPVLLYGYASVLGALARHVLDRRLSMPDSLIGVYSTAEVLDDGQRERMRQAFGCRVYNQYGCREVPNIAWECRHGGMHVFADLVYLESRRSEGEDRLLVTSLTNRLMPFIRYDVGDAGRLREGECACGSPFPLLEMGLCRQNDLVRTVGGRTIHPAYFNRLLYGLTQIRQYQWVQRAPDRMCLNLVADERLDDDTLGGLKGSLRREVDAGMELEVNYLDHIPLTASGKRRFVLGLGRTEG